MKASLGKVLADSHIASIAIALLMARSLMEGIDGLALPVGYGVFSAPVFLLTAVTEREMPYISPHLDAFHLLVLCRSLSLLKTAATCAIAAWLLARWV